jgi:cellulose biosynthesis protein BcsQ
MEWLSDLGVFFTSSAWKMVAAVIAAGGGLIGLGVTIGRWWSKGERTNLEQKIGILDGQVKQLQLDHQAEKGANAQLQLVLAAKEPEVSALKHQVAEADKRLALAKQRLVPYYHAYLKLKPERDELKKGLGAEKDLVAKLTGDVGEAGKRLVELERTLDQRQADLNRTDRRIQKALRLEGNLWAARALQKVPKFRPLGQRKHAVVSVMNLKGGVGKTTVTAHLGFALARRGYRVLLLDLDLQGSLTQILLPFDKQRQLAADGSLLQHFLSAASADKTRKLADYAQEVCSFDDSGGQLDLVATSDNLAYAELSLTLGWLLRTGERDNRFLIRKALQLMSVGARYDLVLLDCPPLVNISCINALAASDYLLVPVTLGQRSIDRVPVLLKRFLKNELFRKHINHDLRVLGVVANRTYREELTGGERADWRQLGGWCKDAYGEAVKQFDTVIPQMLKDVRDAETLAGAPDPKSKLAQLFAALAAEVERELPSECRRGAAALS